MELIMALAAAGRRYQARPRRSDLEPGSPGKGHGARRFAGAPTYLRGASALAARPSVPWTTGDPVPDAGLWWAGQPRAHRWI